MSIQDPNDPCDWLPNEFPQPSATPGERPRDWLDAARGAARDAQLYISRHPGEPASLLCDKVNEIIGYLWVVEPRAAAPARLGERPVTFNWGEDAAAGEWWLVRFEDGEPLDAYHPEHGSKKAWRDTFSRWHPFDITSMHGPNGIAEAASPGERPVDDAETYSNAAENALNLIAEACGFAREWDYPLQIVRDVEDRMRELAALKAASPGERAPGGGPPRCELFDSLTGMRCAREAGHPGMHAHDDSEHPGAAAPAVSPPLRDESVPPPGWEPSRDIPGLVSKVSGYVNWPLACAWAIYDAEHGYGPAAPGRTLKRINDAAALAGLDDCRVEHAAAPATPEGGREAFCPKCGAPEGYQAECAPDAPRWSCTRCGATFLALAAAAPPTREWRAEEGLRAGLEAFVARLKLRAETELAKADRTSGVAFAAAERVAAVTATYAESLQRLLAAHPSAAPAPAESEGTPAALLAMTQSRDDWRCAYHAMAHRARKAEAAASPGERPVGDAKTYSNAAENALNLIAEACGFAREWDYPLQIVRDVEDRMRELAALKAAAPGAPAVSPPLRDGSAPPPGVVIEESGSGYDWTFDFDKWWSGPGIYKTPELAARAAWRALDANGYIPAAPSTREGPGDDELTRLSERVLAATGHDVTLDLQREVERLRKVLLQARGALVRAEGDFAELRVSIGLRLSIKALDREGYDAGLRCSKAVDTIDAALSSTGGADPRGHFLRELASEFFHESTFDDLIAASPNAPVSVVIADELYRRAVAFGGVAGR